MGEKMLSCFGELVRTLFSNWETFLSSFLLGKLSFNKDFDNNYESSFNKWLYSTEDKITTRNLFGLITSKKSPLNFFSIGWDTQADGLCSYIKSIGIDACYTKDQLFAQKDAIARKEFNDVIVPIFKQQKLDSVLSNKKKVTALLTINTFSSKLLTYQENVMDLMGNRKYDDDEYAFFASYEVLFTNKGIYSKKKKELLYFPWKDDWRFNCTMGEFNWININIGSHKAFDVRVLSEDIVGKYNASASAEEAILYAKDYLLLVESCFNEIKEHYLVNAE